jgi:predicted NAD/FAD-binding protein
MRNGYNRAAHFPSLLRLLVVIKVKCKNITIRVPVASSIAIEFRPFGQCRLVKEKSSFTQRRSPKLIQGFKGATKMQEYA